MRGGSCLYLLQYMRNTFLAACVNMDVNGIANPNHKFGFQRFAFDSTSSKAPHAVSSSTSLAFAISKPARKRKASSNRSETFAKKVASVQDTRLPDYLQPDLDIVFVGFNPGLNSASRGHHYAGPGNHFWKCLSASGLVPENLTFEDDVRIIDFGIGLTNIVSRPSASSSDLSKSEMQEGAIELRKKLISLNPKIVVFNGLGIYEVFSGRKDFHLGKQDIGLTGANGKESIVYVMPSSSPRGSKWPTMKEKMVFYAGLVHLRDYLQGKISVLDADKIMFAK